MKQFYSFFVIALFSVITISAQQKKILFIGNSYTGANNLPNLVNQMATSTGIDLMVDSHTPGGTRLMNHAASAQTLAKINADQWDFVVLQAQSQEPSWGIAQVEEEVFPYATTLCDQIRENNACSIPVFYTTWGRENGDASNCPFVPEVCTFEGMNNQLIDRYTTMANDNEGYISPVAVVWANIRENHPEIDLYTGDGSHPTLSGSYLAACTFYTIFFQEDPTEITFNSSLETETTTIIKNAVKEIVFDDLENWNVNAYDPIANFVFTQNENEITLTNTSGLSETYSWDFGDGSEISTEENPVHTYTEAGTYTITLTAEKCGAENEKTLEVTISESLNVEVQEIKNIRIFPTVVEDKISIIGNINGKQISIHNSIGKLVKEAAFQKEISLKELTQGIYFINILDKNGEVLKFKILKK
ncbi:PKD domain-containing protein [Aureivirga marina]|uniref:PKD domain-containing protein n=1 Tax=Aureivirga marina TaxID=1182451 RepID=UPI0018CBE5FC|nr:PKD domain-containing protein [Aureivirga marina]